jgi:peptide chain release factor 1
MFEKLVTFERRLEVIERMMMDPQVLGDSNRLRELGTEHAHVSDVVEAWDALKKLQSDLADAKEMLAEDDAEMKEMAREEVSTLEPQIEDAIQALKLLLLPKDPYEGKPILLEIRAGTGGDEAALFAGDLYRMYMRFAERNGFKTSLMSMNQISVGGSGKTVQGFKEIILSLTGENAYKKLQFESGVHRVQRVPATESQGRVHTSAATVAVLPEPEEVDIKIEAKDLRIDTMRAGGPGGQSVNTTDSAVRIVHIPTGLIVQCQDEKSQLKNKDKAMRVLKARLHEKEQASRHAEAAANRKAQVGSGDRSERIRTYNYPQNRVTDHRIGLTVYKLDTIIGGECEHVIDPLITEYQAKLLADQET